MSDVQSASEFASMAWLATLVAADSVGGGAKAASGSPPIVGADRSPAAQPKMSHRQASEAVVLFLFNGRSRGDETLIFGVILRLHAARSESPYVASYP